MTFLKTNNVMKNDNADSRNHNLWNKIIIGLFL